MKKLLQTFAFLVLPSWLVVPFPFEGFQAMSNFLLSYKKSHVQMCAIVWIQITNQESG